jgi:hypothetical protein
MKIGKQLPWICLIFKIVSEKEKSSKNQRFRSSMDLTVWAEWFDHDRTQKGGKCLLASGPQGRKVTIIKERWRNNSTSNNQWNDALVMPCYLGTRNLLLIFARLLVHQPLRFGIFSVEIMIIKEQIDCGSWINNWIMIWSGYGSMHWAMGFVMNLNHKPS